MPPENCIENAHRPHMVVLTAFDGETRLVVSPEQTAEFVMLHSDCVWIAHNARFDYWVICDVLNGFCQVEDEYPAEDWFNIADQNRLHDTMILDFLIRLGVQTKPDVLRMRGLEDLAKEFGIFISKKQRCEVNGVDQDVRTTFGQFRGRAITDIPVKYLDYAVDDTVATLGIYRNLITDAEGLCTKYKAPRGRYGLLTHNLQVRADIVLAEVGKTGFAVDQCQVVEVGKRMWSDIQDTILYFSKQYPLLFDYYSPKTRSGVPGAIKIKKDNGLPALKRIGIIHYLSKVVEEWQIPPESLPVTDKTKELGLKLDVWQELARGNDFVDRWITYANTIKLHQYVRKMVGQQYMHADYRVLLRTGRTSCTGNGGGVNIQQWPKSPEMRSMFVARPGHKLIISDFSAIELCTLATVLVDKYGASKLAEVLQKGIDPHAYTASMVRGISLESFMGLKQSEPEVFKRDRQAAKAINFGVPGGLGPRRLCGYARFEYGVDMPLERATELRSKLITEIYPEIGKYLKSFEPVILARNLRTTVENVILTLDPTFDAFWYVIQRIVGITDGLTLAGKQYSKALKKKVWDGLIKLNKNPDLSGLLYQRQGTPNLRRLLFGDVVFTRTGRIRAGVDYGEARNTPFQGLAADGAKVALWELFRREKRIIAFIHDEIVVEEREEQASETAKLVESVMIDSMKSVVGNNIPIKVETHVGDKWIK